jgi:hypothetical protein
MATARRRVLTGLLAGGAAATAGVVHMAEAGTPPQAAELVRPDVANDFIGLGYDTR